MSKVNMYERLDKMVYSPLHNSQPNLYQYYHQQQQQQNQQQQQWKNVRLRYALSFFLIGFFINQGIALLLSTSISLAAPRYHFPLRSGPANTRANEVNVAHTDMAVMNRDDTKRAPATEVKLGKFCEQDGMRCVFDIGHNTGQDTRAYLQEEGVKVIAVDANPQLIAQSNANFAAHVASQRLKLLNTGLSSAKANVGESSSITFWMNVRNDKFSSFKKELGCRHPNGTYTASTDFSTECRKIDVKVRSCRSLIEEFGRAEYIKIDIEGKDIECMHDILDMEDVSLLPTYMSVENVHKAVVEYFASKGYSWFKAVDQLQLERDAVSEESKGWSGPWGERAVDFVNGSQWVSAKEMVERLPLNVDGTTKNGKSVRIWYDLHAKRA